jgi:hypothetical protein
MLKRTRSASFAVLVAAVGTMGACVGEITPPGAQGEEPGISSSSVVCNKGAVPGEAPIRRLSNAEYQNTIADLFGDDALAQEVSALLPSTTISLGFHNGAKFLQVSASVATAFMDSAEKVAETVSAKPFSTCDASEGKACATKLITEYGLKTYRRPLTPEEIAAYETQYDKGAAEGGFQSGMNWVIFTMLESPYFLYRVEFGQAASGKAVTRPSHYEMASRLSYLIWQSMPDDILFSAAKDGKLGTKQEVANQARRMMEDPKAKRVRLFFEEWFDLDTVPSMQRDDTEFPEWNENLGHEFVEETRAFIDHVLWEKNGDFRELFTASYSFLNADLADHYGVSGPTGADFVQVNMPERAGILTQAGVVAAHDRTNRTAIVNRGLKIRTDVLCQTIGPPPNDVIPKLEELSANATQAQRLAEHRANPACAQCHDLTDPVGVAFEGFDALGRKRSVDEWGVPVTTQSDIIKIDEGSASVANAQELASVLADSKEVRECFTTQTFRYFYGRAEADADACSQKQLNDAFAKSSYSMTELIVALTQTDAFLYRPTVVPGVSE